jgi:hypothetical protein
MPLGLLPFAVGLLGLGSLGQKRFDTLQNRQVEDQAQADIARRQAAAQQAQEGIDFTQPGSNALFGRNLLTSGVENLQTQGGGLLRQQMSNELAQRNRQSLDVNQQVGAVDRLRGNFQAQTKDLLAVRDNAESLLGSIANPTSGVDTFSTLFKLVKTLDSGIVTNEDLEGALSSMGLSSELINKWKGLTGEPLGTDDRAAIGQAVLNLVAPRIARGAQQVEQFQGLAGNLAQRGQFNLDPNEITGGVNTSPLQLPESLQGQLPVIPPDADEGAIQELFNQFGIPIKLKEVFE